MKLTTLALFLKMIDYKLSPTVMNSLQAVDTVVDKIDEIVSAEMDKKAFDLREETLSNFNRTKALIDLKIKELNLEKIK